MRIGFVTCVRLGYECIEAIHSIGGKFSLFVTLEDTQATQKAGHRGRHRLDVDQSRSCRGGRPCRRSCHHAPGRGRRGRTRR